MPLSTQISNPSNLVYAPTTLLGLLFQFQHVFKPYFVCLFCPVIFDPADDYILEIMIFSFVRIPFFSIFILELFLAIFSNVTSAVTCIGITLFSLKPLIHFPYSIKITLLKYKSVYATSMLKIFQYILHL